MMTTMMTEHLQSRYFNPALYSGAIVDVDRLTVLIWNLVGQLVGYQVYRPDCSKNHLFNPRDQRYFTFVSRFGGTTPALAVWGLETLLPYSPVFICEGIFDACRLHWFGIPAIAALTSDPKHLRSWLACLPNRKIAVCDGDVAGRKLAKYGDASIMLPDGADIGSLTSSEFEHLFLKK